MLYQFTALLVINLLLPTANSAPVDDLSRRLNSPITSLKTILTARQTNQTSAKDFTAGNTDLIIINTPLLPLPPPDPAVDPVLGNVTEGFNYIQPAVSSDTGSDATSKKARDVVANMPAGPPMTVQYDVPGTQLRIVANLGAAIAHTVLNNVLDRMVNQVHMHVANALGGDFANVLSQGIDFWVNAVRVATTYNYYINPLVGNTIPWSTVEMITRGISTMLLDPNNPLDRVVNTFVVSEDNGQGGRRPVAFGYFY